MGSQLRLKVETQHHSRSNRVSLFPLEYTCHVYLNASDAVFLPLFGSVGAALGLECLYRNIADNLVLNMSIDTVIDTCMRSYTKQQIQNDYHG